jgi:hypothetical protein
VTGVTTVDFFVRLHGRRGRSRHPAGESQALQGKVFASLGHWDVGQALRRYPSTPLGEHGRWTSVGGRIISGKLKERWLSCLRDLLDETLEATIGGVCPNLQVGHLANVAEQSGICPLSCWSLIAARGLREWTLVSMLLRFRRGSPHLLLRPSHPPLGRGRCREQPVAPVTDLEGPHGQLQGLPCRLRGEAATAPGFALATRRERFEDRPQSPPFAFRFSVVADVVTEVTSPCLT